MEVSTRPLLFTNALPWNFQGFQGHLSPDLGLACSSLPRDWRMRARTFTEMSVSGWFAPSCASSPASALRCSSSAWRLELAPCGTTNEQRKCEAILCSQCGMPITMYYPYIIIYQYQLHSIAQLSWVANFNQETSGNSMGALKMSYFHSACRYI